MTQERFKELLNLHLDNCLSADETAELEQALLDSPARRAELRQYEAMQGACTALFSRIEQQAPSSEALRRALRQAERRIEAPRSVREAWGWSTWGATGALTACVALVVARLSQPTFVTVAEEPAYETDRAVAAPVALATAVPATAKSLPAVEVTAPNQLAFAAMGMASSATTPDAASRWILTADEPTEPAVSPEIVAAVAVASDNNFTASGSSRFSHQPINTWARSSGFQVQTAGYRFER
jgi:hypothetical protein